MRLLGIVALGLIMLASCNNSSCEKGQVEEVVVNENVVANAETKLAIEGMVCSMGCVTAIQNELRSTNGVAFAEVNFEEGSALIKFDKQLIDEAALIEVITNIGDHAYTAKPFVNEEIMNDDASDEDEETAEVISELNSTLAH
jgi:copper chaperone CopZ